MTSRHLRAVGDLGDRHLDDAEVLRLPVGADHEALAEVLELVLVVALARQRDLEAQLGIGGIGPAVLGRDRALRDDVEVALRLGALDAEVERVVVLLVDERVGAAGVPSTCLRTRQPSSVCGSFST
jgi:hypothetical protein